MDQTQKPNMTEVAENTDLSKQYQDILNQYSKELQANESKSDNPPINPPTSTVETAPIKVIPESSPAQIPASNSSEVASDIEPTPASMPISNSAPPVTPVTSTALPPLPNSLPPIVTGLTPITPPPKNIFKYFFFLSLLIFFGVFGMVFYTLLNSSDVSTNNTTTDITPSIEPVVGTDNTKFCETNDKKIPSGESFPAVDGCNTCTCGDDLTISCTEKSCSGDESTSSASPSVVPTEKVEISVTDPIKTIISSVNTKLKTTYKPTSLDKGKKWSVNLSKSNNKANITLIKKAITDFGLVLDPDLSGEAGTDWKETYTKSADTCTLEMMQGVLTLSCFN